MKKIIIAFLTLTHLLCVSVFASEKIDWGSYMKNMENKIKSNWTTSYTASSRKQIVVNFKIKKDGTLLSHKIVKSSDIPLADKDAVDAIKKSAPFEPLPIEFKGEFVEIDFTFVHNDLK